MRGVTVAYSGVHQAYQLALAAEEAGLLDRFYCSVYAAPSKWGGVMTRLLGPETMHNRRVEGLPSEKAHEHPWPMLRRRLQGYFNLAKSTDWEREPIQFDSWIARRLKGRPGDIFIGVETCCARSLQTARNSGMMTIVDWPGVSTMYLNQRAVEAAEKFSLTTAISADSQEMHERKQQEMELADMILTCSDFHARTLREQGFPNDKLQVVPLWVDSTFWNAPVVAEEPRRGPLRVLYAGKINIRKGVPYLIKAVEACGPEVALTLIGNIEEELSPFLLRHQETFTQLPACTKSELRRHFHQHDLLVLPSLGDSFGFIALEAMACGLPVIVSENCGVPVPDSAWRVEAMNEDALAARLALYAQNRELVKAHSEVARRFTPHFTPARYRQQIQTLLN